MKSAARQIGAGSIARKKPFSDGRGVSDPDSAASGSATHKASYLSIFLRPLPIGRWNSTRAQREWNLIFSLKYVYSLRSENTIFGEIMPSSKRHRERLERLFDEIFSELGDYEILW
ncbi:MAG: hypothetical protein QGG36_14620, partial [Pirellulaceae bacterium]|nr:hypothetical protein [Pirellulaceae bacterium]